MQITTGKDELRRALAAKQASPSRQQSFRTGCDALDALAPNGRFQGGAVHELLLPRRAAFAKSFALLLARSAYSPSPCTRGEGGGEGEFFASLRVRSLQKEDPSPQPSPRIQGEGENTMQLQLSGASDSHAHGEGENILLPESSDSSSRLRQGENPMPARSRVIPPQKPRGAIAWNDPERELYLPAIAAAGIDLRRLILLRCDRRADQLWALAECLRCPGISATVGFIERLNQIEARQLQLAAERGGGVGIFMRPYTPGKSAAYAAATRWLIQPAPGTDAVQRWSVELLHGHGGQLGKVLLLEVDRETHAMRASPPLADRSIAPPSARATG